VGTLTVLGDLEGALGAKKCNEAEEPHRERLVIGVNTFFHVINNQDGSCELSTGLEGRG
jgi:hypothetical protein